MAIIVHIRPIGEDCENEVNSTRLPIKQDSDRSTSLSPTPPRKNKQPPSSRLSTKPRMPPFSQTTIQDPINLDDDNTTSGSTTEENSPAPFDICPPALSNTFSLNSLSTSSTSKVEQPSTPKFNINTRFMSTRKRSLTYLSPARITTRSTQDIKNLKRPSTSQIDESAIISLLSDSDISDFKTEKPVDDSSN